MILQSCESRFPISSHHLWPLWFCENAWSAQSTPWKMKRKWACTQISADKKCQGNNSNRLRTLTPFMVSFSLFSLCFCFFFFSNSTTNIYYFYSWGKEKLLSPRNLSWFFVQYNPSCHSLLRYKLTSLLIKTPAVSQVTSLLGAELFHDTHLPLSVFHPKGM